MLVEYAAFNGMLLQLRAAWSEFEELKNKSGMGWDDDNKMLVASDETWDRLIKVSTQRLPCGGGKFI